MRRLLALVLGLSVSSAAHAQSPPEPELEAPLLIGAGLGMLGAGVALDALLFAVGDDSILESGNGEGGLALAIPPVLVAGGIMYLAGGIAAAAGADGDTALLVGAIASWIASLAIGAAALAIGLDPDARIGGFANEPAATYLGVHAGASLLMGTLTFVITLAAPSAPAAPPGEEDP